MSESYLRMHIILNLKKVILGAYPLYSSCRQLLCSICIVQYHNCAISPFICIIGYSPGDRPLAGYQDNTSGGECLLGFKMALYVPPIDTPTTTWTYQSCTSECAECLHIRGNLDFLCF